MMETTYDYHTSDSDRRTHSLERISGWVMMTCGLIGALLSLLGSITVYNKAKTPDIQQSCDVNPVFSCTDANASWSAHVLGFPNPFLGIAVMSIAAFTGYLVISRIRLRTRNWWVLTTILTAMFLLSQVVYLVQTFDTGALCLYCTGVWLFLTPTWWYCLLAALVRTKSTSDIAEKIWNWHFIPVAVWYLYFLVILFSGFSDYWATIL